MTREQAKDLYTPKSTYPMKMDFIDKIYDDFDTLLVRRKAQNKRLIDTNATLISQIRNFENRTCNNCNYWYQENKSQELNNTGLCKMTAPYCNGLGVMNSNFGCNSFSSK